MPYIVKPGREESNNNMQQTVISKLKKVFVEASSQGNCKLQETVVLTIGQLGRIAEGELLLVVIVSLLESLTAHSQLIRAVAFKQVWIESGKWCLLNCLLYVGLLLTLTFQEYKQRRKKVPKCFYLSCRTHFGT